MQLVELPLSAIEDPDWNPNFMDELTRNRLRASIERFGLVVPLVVRQISGNRYETVGGAQRLAALSELGYDSVSCIVVKADDVEARLLAQALNRIQGEDDLGLKADALRRVLDVLPQEEVLSLLPETPESLQALASLGQIDMASHLKAWQKAQSARLRHLTFQLIPDQLELVEETLTRVMPEAREARGDSPNTRGTALYLLCKSYLEREGGSK